MKRLILSIFILISIPVLGQDNFADSLMHNYLLMDSIAEYNYSSGNDSDAVKYAYKALNIIESLYGEKHPEYGRVLSNLAKYKFEMGDYNEAKDYILESIEIQRTKNPNTKYYAESLSTLSNILTIEGDFTHAIETAYESIKINSDIYGENSVEVANAKGNLADIYCEYGSFTKALILCEDALSVYSNSNISHDSNYATILYIQSKAKTYLGSLSEALEDAKRSYDIFVSLYGMQHPSSVALLSSISVLYAYLGDYSEAYKYGENALTQYKLMYGEEHPDYVVTLQNIADYKYDEGKFSECMLLAEKANVICDNNSSEELLYISVRGKISMSKYYRAVGKNDDALKCMNEVLHLFHQLYNQYTTDYASALMELAEVYSAMGNHKKAIKCANLSIKIMKKIIGMDNLYYSEFLDKLSHVYLANRNFKKAVKSAILSMDIKRKFVINNFSEMSSFQRQKLWISIGPLFFYYAGLAYRYNSPKIVSDVYDKTCLLSKGMLLSTELSMKKLIVESKDSSLLSNYIDLLSLKERYNRFYQSPQDDCSENIDSLVQEINHKEIDLMSKSHVYGNYMSSMNVSWRNIQLELGDNDIAIEFIDFPIMNDSIMYAALTIIKGYKHPHFIPLFELKQLKAIKERDYYTNSKLGDIIWRPLERELEDVKKVYFSPTGEFHRIGIEYLQLSENIFIFDKYQMHRLSSTRQIALNKKDSTRKQAVLYGGIDYDALFSTSGVDIIKHNGAQNKDIKHMQVDSISLRGTMGYLEGTKKETDYISEKLERHKWTCIYYTGNSGTEYNFKMMNGNSPSLLHIATHGFYMTETDAMKEREFTSRNMGMGIMKEHSYKEDKPMTRSGLLLAGCNHALNHEIISNNEEDGILTAQEIASLDLRGLDLVVLSACETGLGDISSGEGVFGLQRGFKQAGAKTIIMSLWKVSDNATVKLMTSFYQYFLDGMSKYDAFSTAREELRKVSSPRQIKPDWAAFVMLDGL